MEGTRDEPRNDEEPDWGYLPEPDHHLEADYEDRHSGGWEPAPAYHNEPVDPDEVVEAWLIAREAELEEQAFALADHEDEDWRP